MNCEQSTKNNELRKIHSFMQNKPNLLNAQINVNKVLERDYENVHLHRRAKTNPQQTQNKPNQTQFLYQKTVDFLAGVTENPAFRRF